MFANFKGKKAICGGTTANLISRELNRPITMDTTISIGKLPSCSYMDGVDLVTEGILTLTKTLEYLDAGTIDIDNAAGKLVKFLLDSDCINFMVGAKLNQAHYDPALPVEIEIRKNIIKKMANVLQDKYFKKVNIQYMQRKGKKMSEKISVKVCLGTTCFVMGSSNLQELIETVPAKYGDKVEVSGVPCLGLCSIDWEFSKAPYVKVDDDVIKEATVEKVLKAIDEKLKA